MTNDIFSVPIYFILFRETLEAAIVISVLLAYLKEAELNDDAIKNPETAPEHRRVFKSLRKQVWLGSIIGFLICLCIGGAFIAVWYVYGRDLWGNAEEIWEGSFCLLACILISIMGLAILRTSQLESKWSKKLTKIMKDPNRKKGRYAMFLLPFITVLREGLEAVVFVGGVSLSEPAKSIPLAVFVGILTGVAVGYIIYKGGSTMNLQYFLIASTCLLYLIAAGLLARAINYFYMNAWNQTVGGDAAESGVGAGSYDYRKAVWHVDCCNPEGNDGWGIFNAILGWSNTAYLGSVIAYCLYWGVLVVFILYYRHQDIKSARESIEEKSLIEPLEMEDGSVQKSNTLEEVSLGKEEASNDVEEKDISNASSSKGNSKSFKSKLMFFKHSQQT